MMDVYLGAEASAGLEAEALDSRTRMCRGLLLGHRRGPRFMVERVFPLRGPALPSEERWRELDGVFGNRVIGFYASGDAARGAAPVLRPFACGLLYLRISARGPRSRRPVLRPHVVEFDRTFRLAAIPLAKRPT